MLCLSSRSRYIRISATIRFFGGSGCGICPFDVQSAFRRRLHTPLGGFQETLPPSFGRTRAKGALSSVNLAQKNARRRSLRRHKRKLLVTSERHPPKNPSTVAEEVLLSLQELIKKNKASHGDIADDMREEEATEAEEKREEVVQEKEKESRSSVREGEKASVEKKSPIGGDCRDQTLLDAAASTRTSEIFPLVVLPSEEEEGGGGRGRGGRGASESWEREQTLERHFAVVPGSTIFGGDLDRLERDMMRDFHQRGANLPRFDSVFSKFGGGSAGRRMSWTPSSSFDHLKGVDRNQTRPGVVGDAFNANLSSYHMPAEAYRETQEAHAARRAHGEQALRGLNYCKKRNEAEGVFNDTSAPTAYPNPHMNDNHRDLAAEANPHFPLPEEESEVVRGVLNPVDDHDDDNDGIKNHSPSSQHLAIDARTDYRPVLTTVEGDEDAFEYDAYKQRPVENRLLELRDMDFWENPEAQRELETYLRYEDELFEMEVLQEGAMDTSEVDYSANRVRKEILLYYQAHPINEMIQESFVRICEFAPGDGGEEVRFHPFADEPDAVGGMGKAADSNEALGALRRNLDLPLPEARRIAQGLGLDLIRVGAVHTDRSDRRVIALCRIADHREHLRAMVRFKIAKLGVRAPPTRELVEVPFRGPTHPHGIRFKAVGVAKSLLRGHAVALRLTDFGTPREGFPVLQAILDETRRQAGRLRAFHTAGRIRGDAEALRCVLHPSTGRSPKTAVRHPSPAALRARREGVERAVEKLILVEDLRAAPTMRARAAYLRELARGTAWAARDDGLSLQAQRARKVRLGMLPKGNRALYAARGDVNIPPPFRANHPTSIEAWGAMEEGPGGNLAQAARGAALLGRRAAMPISAMHDAGETPDQPGPLDRFYYRAQGPALEVGGFKEALGLKGNRRRPPALAHGFASLGSRPSEDPRTPRQNATK